MDNVTDPGSIVNEDNTSPMALIGQVVTELTHANEQMAQRLAEIERLNAGMQTNSESQQIGDLIKGISERLPREKPGKRRWLRIRYWLTSHSTEINLLSIGVGVVGIMVTVVIAIGSVGTRVESLQNQIQVTNANQFVITTPRNGEDVSMIDSVTGRTPLPADKNHYVVVTIRGVDWVQDTPAKVAAGTFTGAAKFGERDTLQGEAYIVRILATGSTLNPGSLPLSKIPKDAIFSDPVTVRRK
ncbi:MAG: hypothetical protein DMF61_15755 [Blastocatellia bacterium AA13]|nr:MAG: hypothetical protein DMF61_15755 [Blastocatellia bacterium AA13]